MFVLVTGGSGLIGTQLCNALKLHGHNVGILSRSKKTRPGIQTFSWDLQKNEIEQEAIERAECIIHLAGENLLHKKWTKEQKKRIIDSRVDTANLLYEKIKTRNKKLNAFISASAIGYYGAVTSEKIFSESDPPGNDFVAGVCVRWEAAADRFHEVSKRVVKIRTSPVLANHRGFLTKLLLPVKLGLASPLGSGRQYLPWIHIDDICGIYLKALEDEQMEGAFNAAAPDHRTNEEFMRTLASVMNKPFWFPNVPGFLIRCVLGEMGATSLKGSRISAEKIQNAGYNFQFLKLEKALKNVTG